MNNLIYIDIETSGDNNLEALYLANIKANGTLKDPEKIAADIATKTAEAKSKMCVDKDMSAIRMIGIRTDGEYKKMTLVEFCEFTQGLTLEHKFVTYNGLKFDFPVIIRNIVKQELNCNSLVLKSTISRSHPNHIDLMDTLCGYGEWKSLDLMAQVYLGTAKEPIDFLTCSDEELTKHNQIDLEILEQLYQKFSKFI